MKTLANQTPVATRHREWGHLQFARTSLRNIAKWKVERWQRDCGAYGIRTRDLLNAIEALYQLS